VTVGTSLALARTIVTLAALGVSSCASGDDVGACEAAGYCWQPVTRGACSDLPGRFTDARCEELGYGCPDAQQYHSPPTCIDRCEQANRSLAACGIDARFDCSGNAAKELTSCVSGCPVVSECEALAADPVTFCHDRCGS
jgi:hypothetical protein